MTSKYIHEIGTQIIQCIYDNLLLLISMMNIQIYIIHNQMIYEYKASKLMIMNTVYSVHMHYILTIAISYYQTSYVLTICRITDEN